MSNPRHLIVDGANILHAWPDLRSVGSRDRAAARSQLGQRLIPIHDAEGIRVTIVFDGSGQELVLEHPFTHPSYTVIYTPSSLTADDVIEQMVANSMAPADCLVATDDNAERETVAALGAVTVRSDELASWVKRAEGRQLTRLADLQNANARAWKKR